MNLTVMPPDVNSAKSQFTWKITTIRTAIGKPIKGVVESALAGIVSERENRVKLLPL